MTLSIPQAEELERTLIRQQERRERAIFVDLLLLAAIGLLAWGIVTVVMRRPNTVVLTHDLRAGDRILSDDLGLARLPTLAGVFRDPVKLHDVVALRDVPGGTVLRFSDVARPQAVATTNIRSDEPLTPTNVAFKRTPAVENAVTEPAHVYGLAARTMLRSGAVIREDDVEVVPIAGIRPNEAALPLKLIPSPMRLRPNQIVTIVATAATATETVTVDDVRILAVANDGGIVVAMPRDMALKLAKLRSPEVHILGGD